MAVTGFFHHFGTFFLFVATVLLIITDISSPVVDNISILRVELGTTKNQGVTHENNFPSVTFGTFGYCTQNVNGDNGWQCSRKMIGYDPVAVIQSHVSGTHFDTYEHDTSRDLTKVMILHPIATGLAFISFFLALGAGFVGSFLAALGSFITFIVLVVVVITDFVGFGLVKRAVDNANSAVEAQWGVAAWTTLVAGILCLLATVILLFTCCSARLHKRRQHNYRESKVAAASTSPPRRRRWW
ncbi:pali-domain-containing protein [Xylariaceae sp. FL0255]|nr:pali-domain-containing protein [Xylariaceae sp. FL0255]